MVTKVDNDGSNSSLQGTSDNDSLTDWDTGLVVGNAGNDVITSYAMRYNIGNAQSHGNTPYRAQSHLWGGNGNDTINMAFHPDSQIGFLHGHHAYGGDGADIFNFAQTANIGAGTTIVGRIGDFDYSRDKIQIDGNDIDLKNLPSNVRIVSFGDPDYAGILPNQQWLHIKTSTGGNIFYSLNEARFYGRSNNVEEKHFITLDDMPGGNPANLDTLPEVDFHDHYNWVPYTKYAGKGYNIVWPSVAKSGTPGKQRDTVIGSSSNDVIHGLMSKDKIYGYGGNDLISGGTGSDTLYGGNGNDQIWGGSENDTLYGDAGNDKLSGNFGNDTIYAGAGNDYAYAGAGDDRVYGVSGTNYIWGHSGNDWIGGGTGKDIIDGGSGWDTVTYYGATECRVDLRKVTQANGDKLYSIENILGSNIANDHIIGNSIANKLSGVNGNDAINGLGGNDKIYGGNDNDRLWGSDGDDLVYGGNHVDRVYGGNDNDYVYGGNGEDKVYGGNHVDRVYGGNDDDTLYGGDGLDKLYGEGDNDTLYGGNGNDYAYGGEGNDKIYGISGTNKLYGGNGNDRLGSGTGVDYIYGGAGWDTVTYYGATETDGTSGFLNIDLNEVIQQNGDHLYSIEHVFGSNLVADKMTGNHLSNRLIGYKGNDFLDGQGGNDQLYGGEDRDTIYGGDGNDFIAGGEHSDLLYGGAGDDIFYFTGVDAKDRIHDLETGTGSSGHDIIRIGGNLVNSYSQIEDMMTQRSSRVYIDFGNGSQITIFNTDLANMTEDMFQFV